MSYGEVPGAGQVQGSPHRESRVSALRRLVPWAAWLLGLGLVAGPMLWTGLGVTFGGRGDPRLAHYTLEHGYLWLARAPLHRSFWDPPLFYPHANVSAFTDVLLGAGPLYWPWRLLGLSPDTSFQLWTITVWSLNLFAAYLLLRRSFRFGTVAASAGAYLFAFGNPRLANVSHPQLLPQFAVIAATAALVGLFHSASGRARRHAWLAVLTTAVVVQAYTAFYVFFFFGILAAAAALGALLWSDSRRRLLSTLRREAVPLLIAIVVAAALLSPLAWHYLAAADEVGLRKVNPSLMPRPASWVLMGPRNLLYGALQRPGGPAVELSNPSHANGLGLLTTLLVAAGLWRLRRLTTIRLLAVGTLAVVAMFTLVGGFSPWFVLREWIPGGEALRALGRVGMVLLLPASIGLASAVAGLQRRLPAVAIAVLLLLCASEQAQRQSWVDKANERRHMQAVAARIPASCQAFYLVCTGRGSCANAPTDAMWAQIATGLPTINGRYGNRPPHYDLALMRAMARRPREQRRLRAALERWSRASGLDGIRVCWVPYPGYDVRRNGSRTFPDVTGRGRLSPNR